MFTDEPSPFRPRSGSGTTILIALLASAAVAASFWLSSFIKARDLKAQRDQALAIQAAAKAARAQAIEEIQRPPPVPPAAIVIEPQVPRPIARAAPERETIYLCKSYSGGSFWSNGVCSSQRATIERMTTVPGHLGFDQQVAIASAQAQEAASLYASPSPGAAGAIGTPANGLSNSATCSALDDEIRRWDSMARQPQSAQVQDWIRRQRAHTMAERARAGC